MEEYTEEQLALLAKHRPKSETTDRFTLSKEAFSKKRLGAIKEEMDEFKMKTPEALSLCMFGSMVKGTAHEGSDIDGWLFFDSEMIAKNNNVREEKILMYKDGFAYFAPGVIGRKMKEFRDGLKLKTGLEDKDVEHIRSMPISENIINAEIVNLLKYYRAKEDYEREWEAWSASQPIAGSGLDEILLHKKSEPKSPEYVGANLEGMFHLDVGGGIRKYRKMFIEKLRKLGPDGERIWHDTAKGIEMIEHGTYEDESRHYPRTLKEAERVYSA